MGQEIVALDPVILFTAPNTCARVTATALIEAEVTFEPRLIRFAANEHRSPAFLARNPAGRVPTLCIEGAVLTENVAILDYLNVRHPAARLLPAAEDPVSRARQLADLCFYSSTLHPMVTRIRIPTMFAEGEAAARSVYDRASVMMASVLAGVEARLGSGDWWYGDVWSVMDAYLAWVWFRIIGAGFDPAPFPRLAGHTARMALRPAVQKALALEADLESQLAKEGLSLQLPSFSPRS